LRIGKTFLPITQSEAVERVVVGESCVGCAFCMLSCKFDAIEVLGKAEIIHERCTLCRICIIHCPVSAMVIE